jgi:hypothetical protein
MPVPPDDRPTGGFEIDADAAEVLSVLTEATSPDGMTETGIEAVMVLRRTRVMYEAIEDLLLARKIDAMYTVATRTAIGTDEEHSLTPHDFVFFARE